MEADVLAVHVHVDEGAVLAVRIDRGGHVGTGDDAAALVVYQDGGDLREMRELVAQPRRLRGDTRSGPHALHVAQHEIDRLEAAGSLLGEQPRDVGDVALHVTEDALAIGQGVPDRRADVDRDEHDAEADEQPDERNALERCTQPAPQHRLQFAGPMSSDTAISNWARRTGLASAGAAPAASASAPLTP